MTARDREERLVSTFATLADALTSDYDVLDLLQLLVDTCAEVLDVGEAGILLADSHGTLEVAASTSDSNRLVEVMQLSAEAGPCIESFQTGRAISVPDIQQSPARWQVFVTTALGEGFQSAYALPMRLRDTTIGTLNLMRTQLGAMDDRDVVAAQAFADVATIGILQHRALEDSGRLNAQLQIALDSRVVIEQAKGVVASDLDVPVEEAFVRIRTYARSHQLALREVAARIVNRQIRLS
jgi:transcriptional regulator with GAF, ATPase, and Fis domain